MFQAIPILLGCLSVLLLFPAAIDFFMGNLEWEAFLVSSILILFISALSLAVTGRPEATTSRRDVFIFVPLVWLLFSLASALPFMLTELHLSVTDAVFESVSGLTTTGATILTGLDSMPYGILLWRSMTQWVGGLGIVVLGISLLPFLKSGGQQLFALESSDKSEKPFPQAKQYAERIILVYLILSVACATAYLAMGMTPFEAINHAMTTVSTGGFSTSDGSMGHFDTTGMLAVSSVFMFIGGLPFVFLITLFAGKVTQDIQIRYYVLIVLGIFAVLVLYRLSMGSKLGLHLLAAVMFNVISVITTTGFASEDYTLWGPLAVTMFFFLTFVGGCSGSTAGGFKQFRIVVIGALIRESISRLLHPNQVVMLKYGERRITSQIVSSVATFSFLYTITFIGCAIIYALFGLDFDTAISASATAIANVGPGVGGIIGPAGNFTTLPDAVKWILSLEMIIGRLEIMSIFALLLPSFWRR